MKIYLNQSQSYLKLFGCFSVVALGVFFMIIPPISIQFEYTMLTILGSVIPGLFLFGRNYFQLRKNSPKILKYWSPFRDYLVYIPTIIIIALILGSRLVSINTTTIGVLLVSVFGAGCIYTIYQHFSNQPTIHVEETKIKTDFSIVHSQEIYFDEVDDIILYDYSSQKNIGIIIEGWHECDKKMSSEKLFLNRGKLIRIPKHMVSIPMEDLYEILVQRWKGNVYWEGEKHARHNE